MISKILMGTSGWVYSDWKEIFYPKSLPQSEWLGFYQKHFPIVELNATFYRFFPDEIYLKWKSQAKKNFKFIIKVPRIITHYKYLKNCSRDIKKFCRSAALLKNKLALILLQFSPSMPYDLKLLQKALLAFDDPSRVVVEFRHEKWITAEVKELLTQMGCIYCAADSPIMKLNDWVTASRAYIRLHGRKKWYDYKYTKAELVYIGKIVNSMQQQGAKEIYILFNNDYHTYAIENAATLRQILNISGLI